MLSPYSLLIIGFCDCLQIGQSLFCTFSSTCSQSCIVCSRFLLWMDTSLDRNMLLIVKLIFCRLCSQCTINWGISLANKICELCPVESQWNSLYCWCWTSCVAWQRPWESTVHCCSSVYSVPLLLMLSYCWVHRYVCQYIVYNSFRLYFVCFDLWLLVNSAFYPLYDGKMTICI